MAAITLHINGSERKVDVAPETPLLWVLRDTLELTGTKFGCGAGLCGRVHGARGWGCSAILFDARFASRSEKHHYH